jgi:hypothetical protein
LRHPVAVAELFTDGKVFLIELNRLVPLPFVRIHRAEVAEGLRHPVAVAELFLMASDF